MKKVLLSNFKLDGKSILKKGQVASDEIIQKYKLPFLPLLDHHICQETAIKFVCSKIEKIPDFNNNFALSKIKSGSFQIFAKQKAIININPDIITKIFITFPDLALSSVKNHSLVEKNQIIADIKFIDLRYQKNYLLGFLKYFKRINFKLFPISPYLVKTLIVIDDKNNIPKQQTLKKIINNLDKKLEAFNLNNKQVYSLNSNNIYEGLLKSTDLRSQDKEAKKFIQANKPRIKNKLIIMTLPTTIKNIHNQTLKDIIRLNFKIERLGINYKPGNHSVICSKQDIIFDDNNKQKTKVNTWIIIVPISAVAAYGKNHFSSLDFLLELLLQNNLSNYLAGRGIRNCYFGKSLLKDN